MIAKVKQTIDEFRNEKGVDANALILGADVMRELSCTDSTYEVIDSNDYCKSYVWGCEILFIDYARPQKIQAVLV